MSTRAGLVCAVSILVVAPVGAAFANASTNGPPGPRSAGNATHLNGPHRGNAPVGGRHASGAPHRHPAPPRRAAAVSPIKLLTFVEENHSLKQMRSQMPYLNRLANRFAYATEYHAVARPSLPNYLAIAGGSRFGVTTNQPPRVNAELVGRAQSIFGQAIASGHTAKTYAESMPTKCALRSSGQYAVKHNPWPYFRAGRSQCKRFDVPSGTPQRGALRHDILHQSLPHVGMVIPNLCHDAHNCSLAVADRWLRGWLPMILRTPAFRSGRLAVVVTADEGDKPGPNRVLTAVLHAGLHTGRVVKAPLTHFSLSRLYSAVIGARPLRHAGMAPRMGHAFRL